MPCRSRGNSGRPQTLECGPGGRSSSLRDERIRIFDGLFSTKSCIPIFLKKKKKSNFELPGDRLNVAEAESLCGSVSLFPEHCTRHSFSPFPVKTQLALKHQILQQAFPPRCPSQERLPVTSSSSWAIKQKGHPLSLVDFSKG